MLIAYAFKAAIGVDILKRYKLKIFEHETILFFDELVLKKTKKNKKIEAEIILSDIRIVYVKKHSSIAYKKVMLHKVRSIRYDAKHKRIRIKMHVPVNSTCFK